ncbi:Protein phosphatase methylesterase 1 [Cytospora mali]|uniref:Protein phosphatase methylesterase 1 n=1 Tax=Cytospora mali TaxID=578113 RepID=A0A194VSC1_CYTMA|nr:Protein phosphatase methylesterase 1 [Valsa mali]
MSDLQKAWAKKKIAMNGAEVFNELDEEEETGQLGELPESFDDDSSSASSASSTGTVVPTPSRKLFARPLGPPRGGGRTLEQIPWTTYFERELYFPERTDDSDESLITQHAYLTSPSEKGPLFVMHHGAGSSGLSFAVVGAEIRKRLPSAGILSIDARGHGSTTTSGSTILDLSLETLRADLLYAIKQTQAQMGWKELPSIVLVGHSLGGAVVTDLAKSYELGSSILGYAVLDVVEGSAMDALQSMTTYLSTRPTGFASIQAGIDWHIRSRTIRNSISARTSVPALLTQDQKSGQNRPWKWRTDLAATEPFWADWFVGLSKKFLEAKGGKLLVLAGTDRLDKELTIGQMQGKYALHIFPEAGHFVHEDQPENTAMVLTDFYRRNDRSALVLPPKVSELLAQGKRV